MTYRLCFNVKHMIQGKDSYKTGLNKIDKLLGDGIEYGSLVIVEGGSSSGKSSLINQMFIAEALRQNDEVFVYSGELSNKMTAQWILETIANEDDFENKEYYRQIKQEAQENIISHIDDRIDIYTEYASTELDAILKEMQIAHRAGKRIFVIDSLAYIDNKDSLSIAKELKRFATGHNSIIVLAVNSSACDSYSIDSIADYVFRIKRVPDNKLLENAAVLSLVKNRPYGSTGEIGLGFIPDRRRYLTVEARYSENKNDYFFKLKTLSLDELTKRYY